MKAIILNSLEFPSLCNASKIGYSSYLLGGTLERLKRAQAYKLHGVRVEQHAIITNKYTHQRKIVSVIG